MLLPPWVGEDSDIEEGWCVYALVVTPQDSAALESPH